MDDTGPDGSTLYHFNGGSNSFVNFSNDLSFEPSSGFTFTSWISQESENDGYEYIYTHRVTQSVLQVLSLSQVSLCKDNSNRLDYLL